MTSKRQFEVMVIRSFTPLSSGEKAFGMTNLQLVHSSVSKRKEPSDSQAPNTVLMLYKPASFNRIESLELNDFKRIKKSKQFEFDWTLEKKHHVFKIVKKENSNSTNEEILGLISLIDFPSELRLHINLIENSNENKGKNKKIDRIAGCLLAFAVQVAFEKGYLGFASLIPKTLLIPLYVNKYGFSRYGRQLAIEKKAAIELIQKYL